MKKYLFLQAILIILMFHITAQESWIIPTDSYIYKRAEELFLNEWIVPPLEERPVIAEDLIINLKTLNTGSSRENSKDKVQALIKECSLPFPVFSPILQVGFWAGFNSETDRDKPVVTNDTTSGTKMLDFRYLYEINEIPSIIKFGFIAHLSSWSVLFQPEVRTTNTQLLKDYHITNLPSDFIYLDNNFPFRGITTYYSPPIEARIGRDKLHLGPGTWSTLTLSNYMPYFDYAKLRFFWNWMSISLYLISLDPTISVEENEYLDEMYNDPDSNPEVNTQYNGKTYIERSKHCALASLFLKPFPWLLMRITQINLIGGRDPDLFDFNPFIVFHNSYKEGTYSVPLSLTTTILPFKGIKLYLDYLLYDFELGDETGNSSNPDAAAYQFGFTILSNPFFKLGPGRFRLDFELSYTDPWVYGKFYNLRKFTSRIINVEPSVGRFWVDYPLGFYLGPDTLDIHFCLSYGIPGKLEVACEWELIGQGNIDLTGWGPENDYTHAGESGYPETGAPTNPINWTNQIGLYSYIVLHKNLTLNLECCLEFVQNKNNIVGDNLIFFTSGFSVVWKIF